MSEIFLVFKRRHPGESKATKKTGVITTSPNPIHFCQSKMAQTLINPALFLGVFCPIPVPCKNEMDRPLNNLIDRR